MKRLSAILLALALLLTGCAGDGAYTDTTLYAMDTAMNLRLYDDADGAAAAWLQQYLTQLDDTLSVTKKDSAVWALNNTGRTEDALVCELLQQALLLTERTGGALDVTVYPAVQLWGFTGQVYQVPTQEQTQAVLERIGSSHVHLSDGEATLDRDCQVDFGALAKGYAADQCRAYLEEKGVCGVLSLGGNVQTVGEKPPFHQSWTVGIQNPDDPQTYLATLQVKGSKAIVTSGDYQRYFESDGVRYCHIFDPATAEPVQSDLRSVTVIADSGLLADGLSTALFVMGLDGAATFWQGSDDFEAVLVADDGTIYVTQGLQDAVSDCTFTVIPR